tara:strand:- start:177 stop:635 length:459 start_codon:yes stop_codon:yes gene_type:complete
MKFFIFIILVFFDFLSKKLIKNFIDYNEFISLNFFLDITHIHNYGISFGLFSGFFSSQLIVFISIIIVILIFFWMQKSVNYIEKWGFLLIISGAISNIGDRAINNFVLDFIFLHYKDFYWPAFNFADIYISIGVLIIIVESLKILKRDKKLK